MWMRGLLTFRSMLTSGWKTTPVITQRMPPVYSVCTSNACSTTASTGGMTGSQRVEPPLTQALILRKDLLGAKSTASRE